MQLLRTVRHAVLQDKDACRPAGHNTWELCCPAGHNIRELCGTVGRNTRDPCSTAGHNTKEPYWTERKEALLVRKPQIKKKSLGQRVTFH